MEVNLLQILISVGKIGGIIGAILFGCAYLTLFERKVIAYMQRRIGPTRVGFWGLLQPIADGIKLLHKEVIVPQVANKVIFMGAPIFTFAVSLIAWGVMPVGDQIVLANINVSILYLLAISSFGIYGILMAGWASNSKYALLGALRSAAQMISYELTIGLAVICVILCAGSLNLSEIVKAQEKIWYVIPLFPIFIVFVISILAETNRVPFDLPEAEAELVAGYFVEYSSLSFALFFLGEYANIMLMSALTTVLFLGGWLAPIKALDCIYPPIWFALKTGFMVFVFVWVRATLPRYRYDQLMRLGWKIFIPITLGWIMVSSGVILLLDL